MGSRRWRAALAVSALLALVLSGCGVASPTAAPAGTQDESPPGYPVSVQNCGRTLTFDRPPERVVTGYEPVLETLIALGLADRVVGRTNFSENGPDGFLPGQKAQYEAIPEISDTIVLPSKEVMLSQQSDFVIDVSAQSSFNSADGQATIEELDASGAQVYVTGGWCDAEGVKNATVEKTIQDVRNLGQIFGVQDRADELATEFETTLADVRARVSGRAPVRVLAVDTGDGPVNAYGSEGLTNQMILAAGGENVLAAVPEDYVEVSVEQIAASQPEALLVADYRVLFGESYPAAEQKADVAFRIVRDSPAAQQRRFLAVPVVGQHPGYRNILTVVEIARFLHPDAFAG